MPAAKKSTEALKYDVAAVGSIEPPAISRPRESSVPQDVAEAMAAAMANGWASNGITYESKEDAQNDAGKFKRAVARVLKVEEKEVASRTWEKSEGQFVFALGKRA